MERERQRGTGILEVVGHHEGQSRRNAAIGLNQNNLEMSQSASESKLDDRRNIIR
jgi:hypothetical protein